MNDFDCQRVENCFSKTALFQYGLSFKIDDSFLSQFEQVGKITCYRKFPRPYFKIFLSDGTEVKGVLSDISLKVSFQPATSEKSKALFEQLLTQFIRKHLMNKE